MNTVADANLALLEETFGQHGSILRVPGREISTEHLRSAEILLLRSVTRTDRSLLEGTPVRFVGTATIGTDHIDIPYLEAQGIHWASAPGCNADAAAQYSLAMAWLACRRRGLSLRDLSVGIVGRGNVGSRLQKLLETLNVPSVACDPPLEDVGVQGLVDLATALEQPVVSLHVPLTRNGPYPTYRMLNQDTIAQLRDGALLVNASRGDVIDGDALENEIVSGRIAAALDVWPGEPDISRSLLARTTVASPHVAGYSVQGKQNGTLMIYRAFCEWQGLEAKPGSPPAGEQPCYQLQADGDVIQQVLTASCGVARDDLAMRTAFDAANANRHSTLDHLRKTYRLRQDFCAWTVSGAGESQIATLRALGFKAVD